MPGVEAILSVGVNAKQTGPVGLGTPQELLNIIQSMEFTPGTATVGQTNVLYSGTRTLAASANENLDIFGALQDALGTTINAAEVVAVYFHAAPGNTNDVLVTRPASNGVPLYSAAGAGISLGAGDFSLRTYRNGVGVVAGTADLINVANAASGSSVTYDVVIVGRTVAA